MEVLEKDVDGKPIKYRIRDLGPLEETLSLAELMSAEDEDVSQVEVEGDWNVRKYQLSGQRDSNARGGSFYADNKSGGGYVAIHSGSIVTIQHRRTPQEMADQYVHLHEAREQVLKDPKVQDIIRTMNISEKESELMVDRALQFGIDPYVLFSMKSLGVPGLDFGMQGAGLDTFAGQIEMVCRMIQREEHLYERTFHGEARDASGRATPGFLVYLSHVYSGERSPGTDTVDGRDYAKKILTTYSGLTGQSYDVNLVMAALDSMVQHAYSTYEKDPAISTSADVEAFIGDAKKYLGRPYVW